jgi:hypothetical protein
LVLKVAAPTSWRPMPTSTSPPISHAALQETRTSTTSAGSRRRARRSQKAPSRMRPLAARSRTRSVVMRKPLTTKKMSTPR